MSKHVSRWMTGGLFLVALVSFRAAAVGQPLPSPANFVSNLDVRCYQISNPTPINEPLQLDHLNPVLQQMGLPAEHVALQPAREFCVPVAKNGVYPPADTLPFIRFVDWKCYGITGPSLDITLDLDHLNPVIAHLLGPRDKVIVREPQQLCVPVAKNGLVPPADVLRLVEQLDVKCYRVEASQTILNTPIQLTHLNPLFANSFPENGTILADRAIQLCVPVAKNQKYPPDDVLKIVQYSDVLCYRLQAPPLNKDIRLRHLNPVLLDMGLPEETAKVTTSTKLCVPVAKNQQFPPP